MDGSDLSRPLGADRAVPPTDLRSRDFNKILLIKLSALGDVVQTFPVLNKLRRRYPSAQIDWLVTQPLAELLTTNPAISHVIEFEREKWSKPWRLAPFVSAARLAARLRRTGYNLVIDLQGQLRSAVFARATGAPVRIGFDKPGTASWQASARTFPDNARNHAWQGAREGSHLAYTHRIPLPNIDVHPVDRYLAAVAMLGLDDGAPDFSFPIPPEASGRIDALFDYYEIAKSEVAVLAPGTIWETKQWGAAGFAEVARSLLQKRFAVTLIGSDSDRAVCEAIAAAAPGTVNLAGETTLTELAALIRRSAICVSNDSGPMHLAVALGRPVLGIFGPTDPVWAGPYRRDGAVVRTDLPCSPCYLRQLSRCPNDHACMHGVSAEAVIARADSLLGKRGGGTAASKIQRSSLRGA
jgi:heptosyltransferase I